MNQLAPPLLKESATPRLERIAYPENPRYRRIRILSVLMDQSIVLPTGHRIGLDPLLGLVPGVGDFLGALVSCYLVYQSARLGLPKRVLLLMLGNVGIDLAVGTVPVAGDLFDAAWKSNMRNLRLLDKHYHPGKPERPGWRIALWIGAIFTAIVLLIGLAFYVMVKLVLVTLAALISLGSPPA